ncbi:vacuolar protein sorting-associated protein 2 homolog 3-like [Quercus robur]|uniref:vacuolar protein sorting-associated protein 2 homolog 3-like n=1 Tax=Quercus robur TaxID=38942 RepID=UPI0021611817|nr:vacuolar protein sorting-associated protein 2 homolog 3-like [Quercus robur]
MFLLFFHVDSSIEKEIGALQLEEKKLVAEIKRTAKTGNDGATKILAHQLIKLRQQIANLQGSRAQIRGIATHTQVDCQRTVPPRQWQP